jgi:hypothetical protein
MAEQQQQRKSAKLVETNKAIAAGMASVVAALFASKLGVAGTLIGTALTAMTVTIGMAILQAQLERAQSKLSRLPITVRGRLSTQRISVPGKPNADPNPETPPEEPRGGRSAGFLERLRSVPGYLKGLSPAARRRVLLSGVLAGLLATAIGLSGVTGIELAGGKSLSCMVWKACPTGTASSGGERDGSSGGGGLSILGGQPISGGQPSRVAGPRNAPQQVAPQQDAPAGAGPPQQPQQQPAAQPQQGGPARPAVEPAPRDSGQQQQQPQQQQQQQQPGGTPQDGTPQDGSPVQPGSGRQPADDGAEVPAPAPDH